MCRMILLVLMLVSSTLLAQATRPASTTSATTQTSDDPRAVLKRLAQATEAGDAAALRSLLLADRPDQQHLAATIGDFASAVAKLKAAALARFGKEGARPLLGPSGGDLSAALAQIDAAKVSLQEEIAIVTIGQAPPVALRRSNGQWKVLLDSITSDAAVNNPAEEAAELEHQARLYTETAGEITDGRFKDAQAVAEALRTKLQRPVTAPTTQSATAPATKP